MAEKFQEDVRVLSQNELGDGIYDLVLQTKEIAKAEEMRKQYFNAK